jgi:hypothetical protein
VTASDADGNFLSETGMAQSPAQEKFLLAFDTTNNINTGAALFNPGSLAVTVTVSQLDSAGNPVTSAPPLSLAPGAQTTAYVSDIFLWRDGHAGSARGNGNGLGRRGSVGAGLAAEYDAAGDG